VFRARYGLIPYIKQITFGLLITVVESVVRTDSLYKADCVWSLNNRGGKCLQRGRTDSLYKADYVWSLNNCGGKCLQRGTD